MTSSVSVSSSKSSSTLSSAASKTSSSSMSEATEVAVITSLVEDSTTREVALDDSIEEELELDSVTISVLIELESEVDSETEDVSASELEEDSIEVTLEGPGVMTSVDSEVVNSNESTDSVVEEDNFTVEDGTFDSFSVVFSDSKDSDVLVEETEEDLAD